MSHSDDDYKPPNHCIGCKYLPKQVSHACPCRPCNTCDDSNDYYTLSKSERYGDNGLNDKPNIEPTNGWN